MGNRSPKILLLCATKKGYVVLEEILRRQPEVIAGICSFREVNMQETYYELIKKLAESASVPFITWPQFRDDYKNIIPSFGIDTIVAVSWKYFLPLEINKSLKNKVIIIHDSLLPRYSGFAPLATAIIKGDKEVGITVLYAAEQVDHGDIILQKSMEVRNDQYIFGVIDAVNELYKCAIIELVQKLMSPDPICALPQDHSKRTYSIWRNPEDCQIDWNNSSKDIYNLIRAVGPPYTGAYSHLDGKLVYIWKSQIIEPDLSFEIRQPGKIWMIDEFGYPVVVCGEGLLKILEATWDGKSILPLNILRQRFYWKQL